jgi:hypothetical protein
MFERLCGTAVVFAIVALGTPALADAQQTRPDRPAISAGAEYRTVPGFVACRSAANLARLLEHVAREELDEQRAMISDTTSGCFRLRGGVAVTPLGFNDFVVEVRPAGMRGTLFTVIEAVEARDPTADTLRQRRRG